MKTVLGGIAILIVGAGMFPAASQEPTNGATGAPPGAALMGDPELIRFLVEQGADLEAKDKYGQTPLTIAFGDPEGLVYRNRGEGKYDDRFRRSKENKKVAELLLELGAAPFTGQYRDRSGE